MQKTSTSVSRPSTDCRTLPLAEVDAVPPREPGSVVLVEREHRCLHHAELGIPLILFPLTNQLGRGRFLCRRQELQHGQGTASVESSGEVDVRQIPTPSATTAHLQEGRVRRIKGTDPSGESAPGERSATAQSPTPYGVQPSKTNSASVSRCDRVPQLRAAKTATSEPAPVRSLVDTRPA
jgi:hypothetical protein